MPVNETPSLSVVVCAGEEADGVRRTLEALTVQTVARESLEVVVVDDGSSGAVPELARAFERKAPLQYDLRPQASAAEARARGAALAQAPLVLFLDAGDVADPGLVAAHLDAHRSHPAASCAIHGHRAPDAAIASDPLVHFLAEVEAFPVAYRDRRDGDVLSLAFPCVAGTSFKRALLANDEPASSAGCEDAELAVRLSRRGCQLLYAARARTTRTASTNFDAHCEERRRLGSVEVAVSRRAGGYASRRGSELEDGRRLWADVASAYDALLRSARELDRIARLRADAGLPLHSWDLALLHRGYWAAFRASWAKGVADSFARDA